MISFFKIALFSYFWESSFFGLRIQKKTWLLMSLCSVASFVSHIWGIHGLYVAHQSPLSMGFSRQEYWSGLPCPSPRALLNSGIERVSPGLLHCRQILYLLSNLGRLLMRSAWSKRFGIITVWKKKILICLFVYNWVQILAQCSITH